MLHVLFTRLVFYPLAAVTDFLLSVIISQPPCFSSAVCVTKNRYVLLLTSLLHVMLA